MCFKDKVMFSVLCVRVCLSVEFDSFVSFTKIASLREVPVNQH